MPDLLQIVCCRHVNILAWMEQEYKTPTSDELILIDLDFQCVSIVNNKIFYSCR